MFPCPRRGICQAGGCAVDRISAPANPLCGRCKPPLTEWWGSCVECDAGQATTSFFAFISFVFMSVFMTHRASNVCALPFYRTCILHYILGCIFSLVFLERICFWLPPNPFLLLLVLRGVWWRLAFERLRYLFLRAFCLGQLPAVLGYLGARNNLGLELYTSPCPFRLSPPLGIGHGDLHSCAFLQRRS